MLRVLTRQELLERLDSDSPLVTSMIDPKTQVQCNGIDFTLSEVLRFEARPSKMATAGRVDFNNKSRRLAKTSRLPFSPEGWCYLDEGCYKVMFNEIVQIPTDIFAIARPRSSMIRSGATVETGLWDSGYRGRSEALLVVFNRCGLHLQRNARIVQVIFFQMLVSPDSVEAYRGRYYAENLWQQPPLFPLHINDDADDDRSS